jgi:uncharacterized repeat protein (TIGR02543 family)
MESQWASLKERDARNTGRSSAPRLTKRDLKRKSRNLEKKLVATLMAVVLSISMTNTTAFSEELNASKSATPAATSDSSTDTNTSATATDSSTSSDLTPQANVASGDYVYYLSKAGWVGRDNDGSAVLRNVNIAYDSATQMGYGFVGTWDGTKYVKKTSTAKSSDATTLSISDNSTTSIKPSTAPFVVLGYELWGWIPWLDTSNTALTSGVEMTADQIHLSLEKSSTNSQKDLVGDSSDLTEWGSFGSLRSTDGGLPDLKVGIIGSWMKSSYTLSFKDKTHTAEIMMVTGIDWNTKLPVWDKTSSYVNNYSTVLDGSSPYYKNPALWWSLPRGDAHRFNSNSTVGSFAVQDMSNPKITDEPWNTDVMSNFTTSSSPGQIDLYPCFMVAYEDASGNVVKTASVDFDSASSKALSYSDAGVSGSGSWNVMSGGTSSVGTVAGDGTGALRVAAANATSGLTVNGTAATVDGNNYVVLKAGGAAPASVDANKVSFGGVKTSDGSTIATNLKVNGSALSASTDYYVESGKTLGTSSSGTQVKDPSTATTTKFTSTDATTSTSGYTFAGWIIGDDTSKTYSSTDILNYQPSAATTIKAYFTKDAVSTYAVTLGSKTEGGGSLQTAPSTAVNGSAAASFKVKQGDTLTGGLGGESAVGGGTTTKVASLASTPTDNGQYQFAGWIIGTDTSTVFSNANILTYKPTADVTINAYYTLKTYNVTIAQPVDSVTKNAISGASASGTNLTGVKSGSTLPGTSTITITPASNYILSGWEESTDGGTTWSAVQVAGHEDDASDLPKYVTITGATTFRPVMAQCYTVTLTVKGSGTLTGGGDSGVTTITRMVPAGGTLDASALRADLATSAPISAVTTTPNHSVFDKWYLGADPSLSAMPTDTAKYDQGTTDIYHYLITGNTTFTAAFTDTYALTWTAGTGVSSLAGTPTSAWTKGDSTTTPTLPTATAATGYSSSPATYSVTKTSDGTTIGSATDASSLQGILKNVTAPVTITVSLPARTGIGYTVVKHFEMPDHSSTVTTQTGSYSTSTVSAAGASTGTFGGKADLTSADLILPSSVAGLSGYAAANYTGLGNSNVSVNTGNANIQNVLSNVNTSTKKISVALNSVDASSNVIDVYYYLNTYNVAVSYASNDAGKAAPSVPTTIASQAGAYRVGQQISFASPINATVPGSTSVDPEWSAANTIDSGNKAIASANYTVGGSPATVAANTTFKMPAADVAVTYTWAPVTKSVYYSVGVYDGTNVSEADAKGNVLSVTNVSGAVTSPTSAYYNGKTGFTYTLTPSTGYRFKGWYYATSSNTDFGAVSSLGTATDQPNNQTITSNTKFVAVFEKIPVTTTFSLSTDGPTDARGTTNFSSTGSLTGGSTSANYGDKPTYPTYTTSDSKVYDGGIDWYAKNDDTNTWTKIDVGTFTVTDKEHVLKGVPTLKSYTVTFVADGVNCAATAKSYTGYYNQPLTSFKDGGGIAYGAGAVAYTPTAGKTLQANGWDWTTTNPASGSATWTNQSADPGSSPVAAITANTWYRANYTAGAVKYYVQRFYQDAPASVGAAATYTAGSQEEVASATVGSTLLFKDLVSAHKFVTGIDTGNLPNGVDGAAFTNGANPATVAIGGSTSSYSDAANTGSTLALTMAETAGSDSPNIIKLYYMRNAGLNVGYGWQTTDKDDFNGTGTFVSTSDRTLPSNKSNVVYGTKVTLPGYDEGAGTTVPADINDYVHFQGWKITKNGTTTIIKKSDVTSANSTVTVDADTTITGYWYRDNITVKFQLRDADKSIATFTAVTGLTQQSVKYGDSIVTTASGKTLTDQVSMNSGNTKYHNGWTNGTADGAPTVTVTSAINTSNFNIDSGTVNLYAKFSDGYQIQYLQGASPVNGAVKVGTWATDDKTFTVAPNAPLTSYDADNIPNDGEYLAGYTFLGWTWTEGADTTKYFYSPGNQTTPSGYTQKSLPATTSNRTFTAVWSAKTLGVVLSPTLSKTGKDDAGNSLIGDASTNTSLKSDYTILHNGVNTDVSPDTSYTLPTATQLTRTGYTLAGYEFVQSSTQLGDQSRGTNLNTRITGSGTDADPWQVYIGAPTSCTVVPIWHRVQNNVAFTYAAQSGSNIDKLLSSSIGGKTVVDPSALAKTDAQYGTAMTIGDGITANAIPAKGNVATFTDTDSTTYSYTFMGWTAQPTSKTGETATVKDDNTYTMPGDSLAIVGTWKLTEYPVTFAASVVNTDETVSGKVVGSGATQQVQHNGKANMDNVTTSVVDAGGAAKNGYKIDHWEKTVDGSTASLGKNTDGDPISPITVGITAATTFTAVYVPDDNVDYTVNVHKQYVKADGSLDYALATFTGHDGKVGTQMKEQAKVWELASWPDAGSTYPIPAGYSLNTTTSTNTKYVTPAINPDDTGKNVLNVYFDISTNVNYSIVRYYQNADGTSYSAGIRDADTYADGRTGESKTLAGSATKAKYTPANDSNATANDKWAAGSVAAADLYTVHDNSQLTATIKGDGTTEYSIYYDRALFPVTFTCTLDSDVPSQPETTPVSDKARWGSTSATSTGAGSTVYASHLPWNKNYVVGQYTFAGWSDKATVDPVTVTTDNVMQVMPARQVDLTGQWGTTPYTVTYAASLSDTTGVTVNSGNGVDKETVFSGKYPTMSNYGDTSQTGTNDYVITGWTYSVDGVDKGSVPVPDGYTGSVKDLPKTVKITNNTTFYATWGKKAYTVQYVADVAAAYNWTASTVKWSNVKSGTALSSYTANFSASTTGAGITDYIPKAASGYTFQGWDWTEGGKEYCTVNDTAHASAYANYVAKYGDTFKIASPDHWSDVLVQIAIGKSGAATTSTGDITFTAVTSQNTYNVEYYSTLNPTINPDTSKTYTRFTDQNTGSSVNMAGSKGLKWGDHIYQPSVTADFLTNAVAVNGYTFAGWYTNPNCGTGYEASHVWATDTVQDVAKSIPGLDTGGTVKLYAKYTANPVVITYVNSQDQNQKFADPASGSADAAGNVKVGNTYLTQSKPDEWSYAGHKFLGWTTTSLGDIDSAYVASFGTHAGKDFTPNSTEYTIQASGNTFYAVWGEVSYNIEFSSGDVTYDTTSNPLYALTDSITGATVDNTSIKGISYTSGVNLAAIPAAFESAGNTSGKSFLGWSLTAATNQGDAKIQMYGAAQNTDGASLQSVYQAVSGNNSFAITDGYTFKLKAVWANTYKVIYHANGGTVAGAAADVIDSLSTDVDKDSTTGKYLVDIKNAPANLAREGYTFAGWSTDATSKTPMYSGGETGHEITGTTNLYAVWTPANTSLTVQRYLQNPTTGAYPTDPNAAPTTVSVSYESDGTTKLVTGQTYQRTNLKYANDSIDMSKYDIDTAKSDASIQLKGTAVSNVLKVYYKLKTYTVTYKFTGIDDVDAAPAAPVDSTIYRVGQGVSTKAVPSITNDAVVLPDGAAWADQATSDAVTISSGSFNMPNRNVTLVIQLAKKPYAVSYVAGANGSLKLTNSESATQNIASGTQVDSETVTWGSKSKLKLTNGTYAGDTVAVSPANGYAFIYWSWTDASGNHQTAKDITSAETAVIKGNTVFTANFAPSFTVTYHNDTVGDDFNAKSYSNLNGVSGEDLVSAPGSDVTGSSDPAVTTPKHLDGYDFKGWHVQVSNLVGSDWTPQDPASIKYTTWSEDPNGGTLDEVKAGTKEYVTTTMSALLATKAMGDYDFYSVYDAQDYTALFDANGGTIDAPGETTPATDSKTSTVTKTVGTTISRPSATRPGFTFAGWKLVEENGSAVSGGKTYQGTDIVSMKFGGMKLQAVWTVADAALTYAISSASNGRGVLTMNLVSASNPEIVSNTISSAAPVGATVVPNPGYEFEKWTSGKNPAWDLTSMGWSKSSGTIANGNSIVPQKLDGIVPDPSNAAATVSAYQSDTFYANFTPKKYTASFVADADGHSTVSGAATTQTDLSYNTASIKAKTGSVDNYKVNALAGYEWTGSWKYTIQCEASSQSDTVTAGEAWDVNTKTITGTTTDPTGVLVRGNISFVPVMTESSHTLTLDYTLSSHAKETFTLKTNATKVLPDVTDAQYIPEGYTFDGWTVHGGDGTVLKAGSTYAMPTADATLDAVWKGKTYYITYLPNSGTKTASGAESYTVPVTYSGGTVTTMGSDTFLPGEGTNNGIAVPSFAREFTTWSSNSNGTGDYVVAGDGTFTMPAHDVTLYANWQNKKYKLTLDRNGGADGTDTSSQYVYDKDSAAGGVQLYEYGDKVTLPYINKYNAENVQQYNDDGTPQYDFWSAANNNYKFNMWYDTSDGAGTKVSYAGTPGNTTVTIGADNEFKNTAGSTTSAITDVTLYANWNYSTDSGSNKYCVVYYGADGNLLGQNNKTTFVDGSNMGTYQLTQNVYKDQADIKDTDNNVTKKFLGWALMDSATGAAKLDANGNPVITVTNGTTLHAAAMAQDSSSWKDGKPTFLTDGLKDGTPEHPLNLVAVYQVSNYAVHFNDNVSESEQVSGTCPDESFTWGAAKDLSKNIYSRNGYKFMGWSTMPGATEVTNAALKADSNGVVTYNTGLNGELAAWNDADNQVTLYAVWSELNNYVVRYVSDYDGITQMVQTWDTNAYKWTANPSNLNRTPVKELGTDKSAYTFEGWYAQKNGAGLQMTGSGSSYDQTIKQIAENQGDLYNSQTDKTTVYLYAQWTKTGWGVNFDVAPGSDPKPEGDANRAQKTVTAAAGNNIVSPTTDYLTYEGYAPNGWIIDTNGDGTYDASFDADGNYTGADAYVKSSGTVEYSNAKVQAALADGGYAHETRKLNARAYYINKSYAVNYNLNIGADPSTQYTWPLKSVSGSSQEVKASTGLKWTGQNYIGAAYTTAPTRDGYTFDGWYSDKTALVYAHPETYGYENNKSTWTVKDLATLQAANGTPNYNTTDYSLYAKWNMNSAYAVKYNLGGGKVSTDISNNKFDSSDQTGLSWTTAQTANGYTLIPADNAASRSGYEFEGWYLTSDFKDGSKLTSGASFSYGKLAETLKAIDSAAGVNAIADNGNVTLYAHWIEKTVPITYAVDNTDQAKLYDGSSVTGTAQTSVVQDNIGGATGANLAPVTAKAAQGYKITGWKATVDGAAGEETYTVGTSSDVNPDSVLMRNGDGSWTLDLSKMAAAHHGNLGEGWAKATYQVQTAPAEVDYTVNYYKQKSDGTWNTVPDATVTRQGTTGTDIAYSDPDDVTKYQADGYTLNTGVEGTVSAATVKGDGSTALKLYYTADPFKATYKYSDDSAKHPTPAPAISSSEATVNAGAACALRTDTPAAVLGWTFDGWDKNHVTVTYVPFGQSTAVTLADDAWSSDGKSFTMPKGDVTITSTWTRGTFDATFTHMVEGGSTLDPVPALTVAGNAQNQDFVQKVPAGDKASMTDANRDGTVNDAIDVSLTEAQKSQYVVEWKYEFTSGPNLGSMGTTTDPSAIQVTGNITFTPIASKQNVVSYHPGVGVSGETVGTFASIEKVYSDTDATTKKSATRYVSLPGTYSLDGTDYQYGGATERDATTLEDVPAHIAGYDFAGWKWENLTTKETGTTQGVKVAINGTLSDSISLTALWAPQTHTLTLDVEGGTPDMSSVDPSGPHKTGDKVNLPGAGVVTKDGFKLTGWSVKGDTSGVVYQPGDIFVMPAASTVLEAKWQSVPVTLNYQPNDATMGSVSPTSELILSTATNVQGSMPTAKAGYHFVDWTAMNGGTFSVDASNKVMPTHPVDGSFASGTTYQANFAPNAYKVTFDSADGGHMNTVSPYTTEQQVAYKAKANKNTVQAIPNKNTTYFKSWKYTMQVVQPDGSTVEKTGEVADVDDVAIEGVTEFTAQWYLGGLYSVAYDTDGGTPINKKAVASIKDTGLLAASNATTKPGYTFQKWVYDTDNTPREQSAQADASNTFSFEKMWNTTEDRATNTVTLHAKWIENSNYKVIYDSNGGGSVAANAVPADTAYDSGTQTLTGVKWVSTTGFADGSLAAAVNIPVRTGYTFEGWQVKKADGTLADGSVSTAQNYSDLAAIEGEGDPASITLVAKWEPKTYKILYYNVNGATVEKTVTWNYKIYDQPIEDETDRDFNTWAYDSSLLTQTDTSKMTVDVAKSPSSATYGDIAGSDSVPEIHVVSTWANMVTVYNEYHLLKAVNTGGSWTSVDTYDAADPEYCVKTKVVQGTQAYGTFKSFPGYNYTGDDHAEVKVNGANIAQGINDGVVVTDNGNSPHFIRYYMENTDYLVEYKGNDTDEVTNAKGEKTTVKSNVTSESYPDQQMQLWTSQSHVDVPDPTRDGYDFIGWNTQADGKGTLDSSGAIKNVLNGNTFGDLTYKKQSDGTWKQVDPNDSNDTKKLGTDGKLHGYQTLYAQWQQKHSQINYDVATSDGSINGGKIRFNTSETDAQLSTAERTELITAITGKKCKLDTDNKTLIIQTDGAEGAKAVANPGWHFVNWTVEYTLSGGDTLNRNPNMGSEPSKISGASADAESLSTMAATGGEYSQLNSILPGVDNINSLYVTATYYAHFEKNDNGTIIYNSNPPLKKGSKTEHEVVNGTVDNTTAPFGSTVPLRLNTDADGGAYTTTYYVVTGWDTKPHDPNEAGYGAPDYKLGDPIVMPEGTTTLYAHWVPRTFAVTITDGDNGNGRHVYGGTQDVAYGNPPVDKNYGTPDYWTVTYKDPITGKVIELPGRYTSLTDIPVYGDTTITPHWDRTTTTTTTTTTIVSNGNGTGSHGAFWLPKTGDTLSLMPFTAMLLMALSIMIAIVKRRRDQDEEEADVAVANSKHASRPRHIQ